LKTYTLHRAVWPIDGSVSKEYAASFFRYSSKTLVPTYQPKIYHDLEELVLCELLFCNLYVLGLILIPEMSLSVSSNFLIFFEAHSYTVL
jgi:hypothetical protein